MLAINMIIMTNREKLNIDANLDNKAFSGR